MELKDIAKKRQKKRKETDLYKVKEDTSKPKFYILDMFPYPSGSALHVGHPKGYIATDALARKKMLEGFNVLHPMGFDTFGLGTEQYAIDHKMKPQIVAQQNIAKFVQQLEDFGMTYDRSRSVTTADPKYFKRTQRIFLQMYNHYYDEKLKKAMPITDPSTQERLAYVDYKPINRCPHCMTGLANEDLDDGKCERCGSEVEQKPMKQRVLRITKYAERLLSGLDDLQREESMKDLERNWIGKSEGTQFAMQIAGTRNEEQGTSTGYIFEVYTTRIDTVFGMSFVAIAPEHPLLKQMQNSECRIQNWKEIEAYQEQANKKTQLERTELQKDKTGVKIEGITAINPFNGQAVPIFVADYVLANYGTGVVMAVPAHDERDFEFAKKYDLPITQSISPIQKKTVLILHGTGGNSKKNRYSRLQTKLENVGYKVIVPDMPDSDLPELDKWLKHLDQYKDQIDDQSIIIGHSLGAPTAIQFLQKNNKEIDKLILVAPTHTDIDRIAYDKKVPSYNNANIQKVSQTPTDWKKIKSLAKNIDAFFSTDDPYISMDVKDFYERDLGVKSIVFTDKGHFNLSGLHSEEFPELLTKILEDKKAYTEKGVLVDSGEFSGLESDKAITKMQLRLKDKGIGGVKVNYKMQDRVFSRQRYRGEPFPVLRTEGTSDEGQGTRKIIPMDEKELPLLLPDVENYEPTGTEEGPLANITERVNVTLPDGTKAKRETNTMPGRAGSSWYWLRYMDVNNDKALVGKDKEKYRGSVDVYVGGAEHITRHMIYGRFWQKFLFDIGAITHEEPFQEYHSVGLIMGEDGRKMSKRRGNVVNPDDIINELGTDVLRAYEMFMGPFDQSIAWSTNGIKGIKKFLDKIILLKDKMTAGSLKLEAGSQGTTDKNMTKEDPAIVNQTIKKVGEDIDGFRFNTAISQLMILANHLTECTTITKKTFEDLVILVSPFAPHLAEELREQLGNDYSLFTKAKWPSYDEKCLVADTVTIGVQVNGKVRGSLCISKEAQESEVMKLAKADEKIAARIVSEPKKVIYVKGKILNIVV